MTPRWTKREIEAFRRDWLSDPKRCGHQWQGAHPRCTACGRKYGPGAGKVCPSRKKPGRWRMHCNRALQRAQYPRPDPPDRTSPAWIVAELKRLEAEAKYLNWDHPKGYAIRGTDEGAWWKFSRDARRYRRLLRQWWDLPTVPYRVLADLHQTPTRDRDYGIAAGRTRLLKRVRAAQTPIVQVGGTTYRFYLHATVREDGRDVPLFTEEGLAAAATAGR